MILPGASSTTLLIAILALICLGSWMNLFKSSGWRFELFYLDFSLAVVLVGLAAGMTLGSLGDELAFLDNMTISGKRQMAFAVAAGVVFNLGNLLMLGAASISGMAVAYPLAGGLATAITIAWTQVFRPYGNAALVYTGTGLLLVAIACCALAWRKFTAHRPTRTAPKAQPKLGIKAIVVALAGGVLMGVYFPLVDMSKGGEIGLGPYALVFLFGCGMFLSTLVYSLYFMNLPLQGAAVSPAKYFDATGRQHLAALGAGIIWFAGMLSAMIVDNAQGAAQLSPSLSLSLTFSVPLVAALWGIFVWGDFQGPSPRVRLLSWMMLICLALGVGLVAAAPHY